MTTQLWIGFAFLALLVAFLITAFFLTPKLTNDQRASLKFLTALCAGFSGGFLTGTALFEMHKTTGATTFEISGTAGCALFFVVWFFYPKVFRLPPGFAFSIPQNWNFRDTAEQMARNHQGVIDWVGFGPNEFSAIMQSRAISTQSLPEALLQLRFVTMTPNAIRPYDVAQHESIYRLSVQ
jgi:hypothetical protein